MVTHLRDPETNFHFHPGMTDMNISSTSAWLVFEMEQQQDQKLETRKEEETDESFGSVSMAAEAAAVATATAVGRTEHDAFGGTVHQCKMCSSASECCFPRSALIIQ